MRAFLLLLALSLVTSAYAEIQTQSIALQLVAQQRLFDGKVEAIHAATVSGQTSGRVADIAFDVGDSVPAGATILRLVSEDQQAGLQQAQAALADARTHLQVEQSELQRIEELFGKGVVSKAELERAQGRFNSREAQMKNMEGALRRARQQLDYTVVTAPFGGVVSERHIELGEAVAPGTPLMSGFDPQLLRVLVSIPQDIADRVRTEATLQVEHQDTRLTAEKILVYPVAHAASGSVKARLNLPAGDHGLRPGQWVKVAVNLGEEQQLLIPRSAVLYRSQISTVYVQQDGALQLRNVRLGAQRGDQVVVNAGLNPGDVLVLNPLTALLQRDARGKIHEGARHE